jgi:NAD(P)-dependent dehydrogenase (short-subunit alcohol dehydrogenase family)
VDWEKRRIEAGGKGNRYYSDLAQQPQAALDVVAEIEQTGVKAAALPLNVGDVGSFDSFAQKVREVLQQRWQRETFDYLLNNAGIGLNIPFAETSEAQFDELMNIQFKGPFFLTQRLLPLLQDGGGSSMFPADWRVSRCRAMRPTPQ